MSDRAAMTVSDGRAVARCDAVGAVAAAGSGRPAADVGGREADFFLGCGGLASVVMGGTAAFFRGDRSVSAFFMAMGWP